MKIVQKTLSKNHNVSSESDMSLFVRYVGFFLFICAGIYIFFFLLSLLVVQFVSLEDEQKIFGNAGGFLEEEILELPEDIALRYQDLGYEIILVDMQETQNAFAGFGGKLYITQAFLDQVESYEELDFIIGHELGHIKERHVLKSVVSEFPVLLFLSLFGGDYGSVLFSGTISNPHNKFQEHTADIYGLDLVHEKNNHIGCALDFFQKTNTIGDNILEIFSTHPMTEFRIKRALNYGKRQGYIESDCTQRDI